MLEVLTRHCSRVHVGQPPNTRSIHPKEKKSLSNPRIEVRDIEQLSCAQIRRVGTNPHSPSPWLSYDRTTLTSKVTPPACRGSPTRTLLSPMSRHQYLCSPTVIVTHHPTYPQAANSIIRFISKSHDQHPRHSYPSRWDAPKCFSCFLIPGLGYHATQKMGLANGCIGR